MKNIKLVGSHFISSVLLALTLVTFGSGCDEDQDLQNWIETTNKLREGAKAQANKVPYRNEQQQALKAFFFEIAQITLALKNDPQLAERFNAVLAQNDLQAVCSKVFMTKAEWQLIMQNCVKNRFYLCAEEVRAYPDSVSAIRDYLTPELKVRFDSSESCQSAR